MTREEFFEKFDLFAELPNAVAKMRELILELAVRGWLTQRRGEDSLDGDWRDFVRSVTERPGLQEPPFDIPSEWRWTTLADLGSTKPRNEVADDTTVSFASMALVPSEYGRDPRFETRGWGDVKKAFTHFADGDVVMAKITPCFQNGKSAVMTGLLNGVGAGTTELHVFRPTQKIILPTFVLAYIKTRGYLARGELVMTGSAGQKRVPATYFSSSPFPLPPPGEQKRIVAKVDELMALCDQLEARQKDRETRHAALARACLARFADAPTPSNLTFLFHTAYTMSAADLRKTISTLAVHGKLIPQQADDEAVEVLLVRNDERRRKTAQKDHRAEEEDQPLLSAEDRWEIPNTWAWRGLADLVLFVDYRGKTPVKVEKGVRLLTAKNVRRGRINLSPEEFLAKGDYDAWMTRGLPRSGDVLFTTEAPMGNAAVIELTEPFALAQRVICFQSYGAIDSAFLGLQILSDSFQLILDKNGTGVTAKGIKASKLKQLPIAVPPLAEQRRIVAKVDQLMALVDGLEAQLAASRMTGAKLLDAVVSELSDVSPMQSFASATLSNIEAN